MRRWLVRRCARLLLGSQSALPAGAMALGLLVGAWLEPSPRTWSAAVAVALLCAALLACVCLTVACPPTRVTLRCVAALRRTLHQLPHELQVPGLRHEASVEFDRRGVPTIRASTRTDACCLLGHVCARDRLFQMDMARRSAAGRLAEWFGKAFLDRDRRMRALGLVQVAAEALQRLPAAQRELLEAYAAGVNSYGRSHGPRPAFEYQLLGQDWTPWQAQDCLLVQLGMFDQLTGDETTARMLAVMAHSLPDEVTAFLTPRLDRYDGLAPSAPCSASAELPQQALAALFARARQPEVAAAAVVRPPAAQSGSNAWAVGAGRTRNGSAFVGNDVHLPLSVPAPFYRARLVYSEVDLCGMLIPGVPAIVAGATNHIAWGIANLGADILDLVSVETHSVDEGLYKCGDRWLAFETRDEVIEVLGQAPHRETFRATVWGPLALRDLMGRPVALRWSALDPDASDFGIVDMDIARGVEQACETLNRTGGPPLGVVVADRAGKVAWTVTGRLPDLPVSGDNSRARANAAAESISYLPAQRLPRVIAPETAIVVAANAPVVGADGELLPGRDFCSGYRSWRIATVLGSRSDWHEAASLTLQLDSRCDMLQPYRDLALRVLACGSPFLSPDLLRVRPVLAAWDGRASRRCRATAILIAFREVLCAAVLGPLLADCHRVDRGFVYAWRKLDEPVLAIIATGDEALLPRFPASRNWDEFLLQNLREALQQLRVQRDQSGPHLARWGRVNALQMQHVLGLLLRDLAPMLSLDGAPQEGCAESVRVATPTDGAAFRMVASPGHVESALFQMPGGQSGHPWSQTYDDQQAGWLRGVAHKLMPGPSMRRMRCVPG